MIPPKAADYLSYIAKNFTAKAPPLRLTEGRINDMWEVVTPSDTYIVRFYPPFFTSKLETELFVLEECAHRHLPTPRIVAEDSFMGLPVLVYRKIEGMSLSTADVGPDEIAGILRAARQVLDVSNEIPVQHVGYLHDGLQDTDVGPFIRTSYQRYLAALHSSLDPSYIATLERAIRPLLEIHGRKPLLTYVDLDPRNLIVARKGDEINELTGIVDWEFIMGHLPHYAYGNLMLVGNEYPALQAAITSFVLQDFSDQDKQLVIASGVLRGLELLSYLKDTGLYTKSQGAQRGVQIQEQITTFARLLERLK